MSGLDCAGAGIYMEGSGAKITQCVFLGNAVNGAGGPETEGGGGLAVFSGGTPEILDCSFLGNFKITVGRGAGVLIVASSPSLVNCVFSGNTSDSGTLFVADAEPTVTNCTFTSHVGGTAAVFLQGMTNVLMTNCIMWGNWSGDVYLNLDAGYDGAIINASCIEGGWSGAGGLGLIADNPLFVDSDGADDIAGTADDNLRLAPGSPCIDAGLNDADTIQNQPGTQLLPSSDRAGMPRFVDDPNTMDTGFGPPPIVDMGAYEFQFATSCPWDLDGSGDVGINDFLDLLARWGTDPGVPPDFDADGTVGILDFLELLGNWGPCPSELQILLQVIRTQISMRWTRTGPGTTATATGVPTDQLYCRRLCATFPALPAHACPARGRPGRARLGPTHVDTRVTT